MTLFGVLTFEFLSSIQVEYHRGIFRRL